jgi:Glycoside hydrolase family 44
MNSTDQVKFIRDSLPQGGLFAGLDYRRNNFMPKFILNPLSGLLLLTGLFLPTQAFAQTNQTVDAGFVGTSKTSEVTNAVVTVIVDATADRHPISPGIYGVAFASSNQLNDLNVPLNRSGGNAETRYNWQLNAHNRGGDWYFESVDDGNATPGAAADDFVANSRNGGAQAMITVPMIGWMPKLGSGRSRLASYSIAKYGPQTGRDSQSFSDAGNGIGTNNTTHTHWFITTNDPNDANFLTNCAFQQTYVQHLINRWGLSTNGGVRYYLMDNEHSIWSQTHQDVHPTGTTMQEIRDKMFEYAGMVKSNDPNALVLGPEEWGWDGYFSSGYDQQNPGQRDRIANGGLDYLPWLLDQFHQRATHTNQRLLDYFTVHYYPQNGEFGTNVSVSMQLTRNRSTRALWDTNYTDESWINNKVMLIPRLKKWVAQYYPGTPIGITEYNWGAENHINGATAQADVLGIFGRENVDMAVRWTVPETNTPVFNAFKMYRNYDGKKSAFGDTSISTAVPDPDTLSAFAAIRTTDGALTVMVINKAFTGLTPLSLLEINHFAETNTAQVWQLTSRNSITRLVDIPCRDGTLKSLLPAQSITLFVLPAIKNPSSVF